MEMTVENMPISISLTTTQWNLILAILAKGPFEQVSDIIGEIKKQGEAAIQAAQPAPEAAVQE